MMCSTCEVLTLGLLWYTSRSTYWPSVLETAAKLCHWGSFFLSDQLLLLLRDFWLEEAVWRASDFFIPVCLSLQLEHWGSGAENTCSKHQINISLIWFLNAFVYNLSCSPCWSKEILVLDKNISFFLDSEINNGEKNHLSPVLAHVRWSVCLWWVGFGWAHTFVTQPSPEQITWLF